MTKVNIISLIGEATEYDKKQMLEEKNLKVGVKVSVLLLMVSVGS